MTQYSTEQRRDQWWMKRGGLLSVGLSVGLLLSWSASALDAMTEQDLRQAELVISAAPVAQPSCAASQLATLPTEPKAETDSQQATATAVPCMADVSQLALDQQQWLQQSKNSTVQMDISAATRVTAEADANLGPINQGAAAELQQSFNNRLNAIDRIQNPPSWNWSK